MGNDFFWNPLNPHRMGQRATWKGKKFSGQSAPFIVNSPSALALTSVSVDHIKQSKLDGNWGQAVINGQSLIWPTGRVTKLELISATSFNALHEGRAYGAKLKNNMLCWDDGDIWTRKVVGETNSKLQKDRQLPQDRREACKKTCNPFELLLQELQDGDTHGERPCKKTSSRDLPTLCARQRLKKTQVLHRCPKGHRLKMANDDGRSEQC
jgi:hypothetical protein